jgi:hypothetical protein
MEDIRNAYKLSVVNLEGRDPLGIHKRIYENNIKTDLKETIFRDTVACITLAKDRGQWRDFANTVVKFRVLHETWNLTE